MHAYIFAIAHVQKMRHASDGNADMYMYNVKVFLKICIVDVHLLFRRTSCSRRLQLFTEQSGTYCMRGVEMHVVPKECTQLVFRSCSAALTTGDSTRPASTLAREPSMPDTTITTSAARTAAQATHGCK